MSKRGKLFILSAPSGTGKDTLKKLLHEKLPFLEKLVSFTTRKPRKDEVPFKDYYFVSNEAFERMKTQGNFLECSEVHGNMYGTSLIQVTTMLKEGKIILNDLDVQGTLKIKPFIGEDMVSLFIQPPSLSVLKERLTKRNTDSEKVISQRLSNAQREMNFAQTYDHIVINDNLDQAVEELVAIINKHT